MDPFKGVSLATSNRLQVIPLKKEKVPGVKLLSSCDQAAENAFAPCRLFVSAFKG